MVKQSVMTGLIVLIVISALSVIHSSHVARKMFNQWQLLQKEAYRLDEDWGRLLLEHSTWAAHDRVERLASERLMMTPPVNEALQLVKVNAKED